MTKFSEPFRLNWAAPQAPERRVLPYIGVGLGAAAVGGIAVAAVLYWSGQQRQLNELTALLEEVRQSQTALQTATVQPALLTTQDLLPQSPAAPANTDSVAAAAPSPAIDADPVVSVETIAAAPADVLPVVEAAAVVTAPVPDLATDVSDVSAAIIAALDGGGAAAAAPAGNAAQEEAIRAFNDGVLAITRAADAAALVADPDQAAEVTATLASATIPSDIAPEIAPDAVPVAAPDAAPAHIAAADQVRLIAARAALPDDSASMMARDEARLAILSESLNGVREIARLLASGSYNIQRYHRPGTDDIRPVAVVLGYEAQQMALVDLLAAAAENDLISYPSYVVDANGKVDAEALLLSAVQEALASGSAADRQVGERLAEELAAVRAAEVTVERGERFYTVESGDSLAFIALQFYGNTNAYSRIFEANRDVLESPERIRIGQRLRIPTV